MPLSRSIPSREDFEIFETDLHLALIDEVESLTAARAGAMSGKEPSDALRVSRDSQSQAGEKTDEF